MTDEASPKPKKKKKKRPQPAREREAAGPDDGSTQSEDLAKAAAVGLLASPLVGVMMARRATRPGDGGDGAEGYAEGKKWTGGAAVLLLVGVGLVATGETNVGPYVTVAGMATAIWGAHRLGRSGPDGASTLARPPLPAFVAPLVGFALGAALAWAAGRELSHHGGPLWTARSFVITLLYAFLLYGPVAGYFVSFETDWAFAYLVDAAHASPALVVVSVLVDMLAVLLGFVVGARPARKRQMFALLPLVTVPNACAAIVIAVLARRLAVHGTTAEYRRDFGLESFAGSPAAYALLFFGACLLLGTTFTVRELRTPRTPRVSRDRTSLTPPTLTNAPARGIGRGP